MPEMPRHLRNTPTSDRSDLRELHTKEPRQPMLDETRLDYRRLVAGCIAVMLLLGAGVTVGRCSAPAAAQSEPQPPLTLDAATSAGYDFHTNAAIAVAELDVFLHSVTTTTTTPPRQARQAVNYQPGDGSRWDQLAQCESGGNWAINTGNGFGGGLQFMHQRSYSTWLSFGGAEFAPHPWEASREQQIEIAERVLASSGWRAWPGCSRKFGWL
jgi:hypothetical protein